MGVTLDWFYKHKLYAIFSKCQFWLNSVAFLSDVVFSEGIRVSFQKIEVMRSGPRPMTPTEVRRFLSLAGYYCRFVEWVFLYFCPFDNVNSQ